MAAKKPQNKRPATATSRVKAKSAATKRASQSSAAVKNNQKSNEPRRAPAGSSKRIRNEVKGICVIAIGLLVGVLLFSKAGFFGALLADFMHGLFGLSANVYFVFIIWTGVNIFIDKGIGSNTKKYWLLAGLMLCASVIAALGFGDTEFDSGGFISNISGMYSYGVEGYGGGVFGSGICRLLDSLVGEAGSWIIMIALSIVLLVLLTGVSIEMIFASVAKRVQAARDKRETREYEHSGNEEYGAKSTKKRKGEDADIEIESMDEAIEEYGKQFENVTDKKKAKKGEAESGDYFDEYFSDGGNSDALAPDEQNPARVRTFKFNYDDEDDALDIEKDASEDNENGTYFELDNMRTGVLTEIPDENGDIPSDKDDGEFVPPSLRQIREAADPLTQAQLDNGVPMDRAVVAAKNEFNSKNTDEILNEEINKKVEEEKKKAKVIKHYKMPSISLLSKPAPRSKTRTEIKRELEEKANKLLETLANFKVDATILNVAQGPSVTRFEIQPGVGVKVSKITNLVDDIALSLAATGVRIEAPIPGKAAIGIEIPNEKPSPVPIREVIDSDKFREFNSKTAFALGKDIAGNSVVADISGFPHVLIAGATGSGKSVCINSLITSILYKASPQEVKMIMVDPKKVELGVYNGIPHLLIPVVTDPKSAAKALNWCVVEMKNRYNLLEQNKVRNLGDFNRLMEKNETPEEKLPEIVIIIDELADLMLAAKNEVEDAINSLAALARAAGMYLVVATQRPSVDVVTGVIKANIPSRIAFAVSSQVDSRTIIDAHGAEKLLGKGDMLYAPRGAMKPARIQGCFVSDEEIKNIIGFIKAQYVAEYDDEVIEHIEREIESDALEEAEENRKNRFADRDEYFIPAVELVLDTGQASVAMFQRKFKMGYQRAARLIDQLEEYKIIGEYEGTKPRQVLITKQQFSEMLMNSGE